MDGSIELSVELNDNYPDVSERYYTTKYCVKLKEKEIEPHCVMFHSNRICLVTLADEHPILKDKKTIVNIDFQISEKLNRLDNKVSGKGKKGAQFLESNSILCKIKCSDASQYNVYSCIRGKLIEINDNLIEKPSLLINKPRSNGFLAIILPQLASLDKFKDEMLSFDEYKKL